MARLLVAAVAVAAVLAASVPAAGRAAAQESAGLDLLEQKAFRAAVDRVAPSVVRIETVGGAQRVDEVLFGNGPTTGVILDPDGYIVSSAFNFVNRPASILVRLGDGVLKPAQLVATDHNRMLVLLKIATDGPLPVPEIVPPGEIRVGQWAIAVGRAFEGDRPNMAVGVLSALGRIWGKALQTDAAVSPNNYGGPLVDVRGRVLGVLVPLSPQATEELAGVEWYDSGIGFAVDAQHIRDVLPILKTGKDLWPGVAGIGFRDANLAIGQPVVAACYPNSPAAKAGLTADDRIVEVEGRPTETGAAVKAELSRRYAGDKVRMVVLRHDKRTELTVELVEKLDPYVHPLLGILPMRTSDATPGVTVRYVYPEGPAAEAGIVPGDVLVSLEGKPIPNRGDLWQRIAEFDVGQKVAIEVVREGQTQKLTVQLGRLPEGLPPPELPPARPKVEPGKVEAGKVGPAKVGPPAGELPARGAFGLKIDGVQGEAWAYVPAAYDPATPHGVVVWLHGSEAFDWDKLLARWQRLCDRRDLILVAPKAADKAGWTPRDGTTVERLLDEILTTYTVDPARVVVAGNGRGGALAYLFAETERETVRAAVVCDGPLAGEPDALDPSDRLAIYLAAAKKSRYAAMIKAAIGKIRDAKIPLTIKDLGENSRELSDDELDELVRWIDMLDRI